MRDHIAVSIELHGTTVPAGTAYFSRRRGQLATTFRYEPQYLSTPGAFAIDPNLPLGGGSLSVAGLPGAFQDCAPDRWGRNLLAKRARAKADRASGRPRELDDVDFLLGVADLTRQGALRFGGQAGTPFLDPDAVVPKLIELPRLLRAAEAVAHDEDDLAALKQLLDAGTGSLGGARPKASVRDAAQLYIAKFAHPADEWDVLGWEVTALDLAERAGIRVPGHRRVEVGGKSVLVLERFDRVGTSRIGYVSAMTLLGAQDGDHRDYLDIAEAIGEVGAETGSDLRELWRRIAFSVAVHNTDDHLRNHGFLHQGNGWELAPIFDVNPNPNLSTTRATSIDGADHAADELSALVSSAPVFGLDADSARQILGEVGDATGQWRAVADANGIRESELDRFAPTLDHTVTTIERSLAT